MTDLKTPLALLLQLVVIALLGVLIWQQLDRGSSLAGRDRVAVLLVGGTAYYGSIKAADDAFVVLKDTHYIRRVQNQDSGETSTVLVKRGQELHGPTAMIIPVANIQFIEPVAADSEIGRKLQEG